MNKKELRTLVRELKRSHSREELDALSAEVMSLVLAHPAIESAQTILFYHSLPDEVCTHSAIDQLTAMGKQVVLPKVIDEENMELREYHSRADLAEGAFHIMEPTGPLFADYSKIQLAIIPGMGFDRQGNRLGRGKGYYDRMLVQLDHAYKIGVCFPFQLFDKIPTDIHDITMDEVLTRL